MIRSIRGLITSLRGDRSTVGLSPTNHQRRDPVTRLVLSKHNMLDVLHCNTLCIVSTALSPSHTCSHFIHMFKGYTDPYGHTGSCVILLKVTAYESARGLQQEASGRRLVLRDQSIIRVPTFLKIPQCMRNG